MKGCHDCTKWDTDCLTYPYGRCKDPNTVYSKEHFESYYLEGSECAYHTPATPKEDK